MRVTPEYVRGIRFGRAPIGHRGYDPTEVDAFCATVADALAGRIPLTAADIRDREFSLAAPGRRDYDRTEVDAFLDRVCVDLERGRVGPLRTATAAPLTADDVRRLRFSAPPAGRAGYVADEVDTFRDRMATLLAGLAGPGPVPLRPEFTTATPGIRAYHVDEVDAFVAAVAASAAANPA